MPSKPHDIEIIDEQQHKISTLTSILDKLKRKYDIVAADFREADGALEFMLGGRASASREIRQLKWRMPGGQLKQYQ